MELKDKIFKYLNRHYPINDGYIKTEITEILDGTYIVREIIQVFGLNLNESIKYLKEWLIQNYSELTMKIETPQYSYEIIYDKKGKPKQFKRSDGYWEEYKYDDNYRIIYFNTSTGYTTRYIYPKNGKRILYNI